MANGQFPVTYDVAAEGTRVAHDDIDALIALQELKTSRGQPMTEVLPPIPFGRDFMIGEEDIPGRPGLKQIVGDNVGERYERGAKGVPIHMPSYATLLEMAFGDVPWAEEHVSGLLNPSKRIRQKRHRGTHSWENKIKAMEMLTSGKDIVEKMRMGDIPGGAVSYHFPKLYVPSAQGKASKGEKQLRPEEDLSEMIWRGNMPHPLKPSSYISSYIEPPDTTKSFVGSAGPIKYGYEDEDRDVPGKEIGVYPPEDTVEAALNTLRTLLHEPFHFPIPLRGTSKPFEATYGFDHRKDQGYYSQGLYDAVEELLQESLLRKYSRKDLANITNRLIKGEEIDYSKYKRLDVGGE
jgi:hypothetical protein